MGWYMPYINGSIPYRWCRSGTYSHANHIHKYVIFFFIDWDYYFKVTGVAKAVDGGLVRCGETRVESCLKGEVPIPTMLSILQSCRRANLISIEALYIIPILPTLHNSLSLCHNVIEIVQLTHRNTPTRADVIYPCAVLLCREDTSLDCVMIAIPRTFQAFSQPEMALLDICLMNNINQCLKVMCRKLWEQFVLVQTPIQSSLLGFGDRFYFLLLGPLKAWIMGCPWVRSPLNCELQSVERPAWDS